MYVQYIAAQVMTGSVSWPFFSDYLEIHHGSSDLVFERNVLAVSLLQPPNHS